MPTGTTHNPFKTIKKYFKREYKVIVLKIHSEQLFHYLESRGFQLTPEDKANIIEIILFGKNDRGKYVNQREQNYGG